MAETPADAVAPAVAGPGADSSQYDLPTFMESDYGGAMHAGSFSPTHDSLPCALWHVSLDVAI